MLCGAALGEGAVRLEDVTSHLHQAGEPVPIPHVSAEVKTWYIR